jgi:hypothetical protein
MIRTPVFFAIFAVCSSQQEEHTLGATAESLQLYSCNSSNPNQAYEYANQTFRGRFSGLCITASGSSGAQTMWPATCEAGNPLQLFVVEESGRIQLAGTTLVMNVPGSRTYDFAVVTLAPNSTTLPEANERFLYNASTGLIIGEESGLCVDAGSTTPLTFLATVFGDHMVLQVRTLLTYNCLKRLVEDVLHARVHSSPALSRGRLNLL